MPRFCCLCNLSERFLNPYKKRHGGTCGGPVPKVLSRGDVFVSCGLQEPCRWPLEASSASSTSPKSIHSQRPGRMWSARYNLQSTSHKLLFFCPSGSQMLGCEGGEDSSLIRACIFLPQLIYITLEPETFSFTAPLGRMLKKVSKQLGAHHVSFS